MAHPVAIEVNKSERSLSALLAAGEIDAIIGTSLPAAIRHDKDIVRLFPDFPQVEKNFFRETGIFPIMHLPCDPPARLRASPFCCAKPIMTRSAKSKALAASRMRYLGALRYMVPWLADDLDEMDEIFGDDPWPYGIDANRPTLEALLLYMTEQGIYRKAAASRRNLRRLIRGVHRRYAAVLSST